METHRPDTRTRLVRTAARLFWERSFHATGVDDICRRAQVRKGSFYHFFASKADLAQAALREAWEIAKHDVFEPVFSDGRSPGGLEQLQRLVQGVQLVQSGEFEASGAFLGCPFGSFAQEMAHQDESLRAMANAILDGHVVYFERALAQAVADGSAVPGDLRGRARAIFALVEGGLLLAKTANSPERFAEILEALPRMVNGN